ncbi:hypothetical protein Tco_0637917 [Tanacetum coccineum]
MVVQLEHQFRLGRLSIQGLWFYCEVENSDFINRSLPQSILLKGMYELFSFSWKCRDGLGWDVVRPLIMWSILFKERHIRRSKKVTLLLIRSERILEKIFTIGKTLAAYDDHFVGSHTMAHTSSGPSTQVRRSLKRSCGAVCANTSSDTYTTITDIVMQKRLCIEKEGPCKDLYHLGVPLDIMQYRVRKHIEFSQCVGITCIQKQPTATFKAIASSD